MNAVTPQMKRKLLIASAVLWTQVVAFGLAYWGIERFIEFAGDVPDRKRLVYATLVVFALVTVWWTKKWVFGAGEVRDLLKGRRGSGDEAQGHHRHGRGATLAEPVGLHGVGGYQAALQTNRPSRPERSARPAESSASSWLRCSSGGSSRLTRPSRQTRRPRSSAANSSARRDFPASHLAETVQRTGEAQSVSWWASESWPSPAASSGACSGWPSNCS